MLGQKKKVSNEDWIQAFKVATSLVSLDDLKRKVDDTCKRLHFLIRDYSSVAFGYSGGKDSIVLQSICEQVGITRCVWVATYLEFPAFTRWMQANKPIGLEVVNTGQNVEWLTSHKEFLFPSSTKIQQRWFSLVQWAGQRRYRKERNLDLFIVGRRLKDGNNTGINGLKQSTNLCDTYSPLFDWTHEEVLAYIRYFRLPLPPIYNWPRGWVVGTGPWNKRKMKSTLEGWREVYKIDAALTRLVAPKFESGREFLRLI